MSALYNEFDPFAAAWLRELIREGHIRHGEVDGRSIVDLRPADLAGQRQVHLFAGVGVWSYALRRAGWADDRSIWTASFPCQPFSVAGKGRGAEDDRHLWPVGFGLIRECRPGVIIGEQVSSPDGLGWFDAVSADLEGAGYAVGALDTCAAGVGAPHIRQRLYWCAIRLADAKGHGHERPGQLGEPARRDGASHSGAVGGVANPDINGRLSVPLGQLRDDEHHAQSCRHSGQPGPANGIWRAADWLGCRDGKWRPVEPGTFPLAHGAAARVGRLRGYGNALNAEQATVFVQSVMASLAVRAAA